MGLTTETHNSTTAVLVLAHGSASTPSEVPGYLRYVTSGRGLPQTVVDEITHRYALVGSSPLTHWTLKQSYQLADELHLPVYVGMRNWQPFISDVVRGMVNHGIIRAVVICMAPHNSRTSVGLYRRALGEQAGAPFVVEFIDSWHDHPLLVQGLAESFQLVWQGFFAEAEAESPLFSQHTAFPNARLPKA